VAADEALRFIAQATESDRPFALWLCTQVPHMDGRHTWPARQKFLDRHPAQDIEVPLSWDDDLSGKPAYLKSARNRTRGLEYGYDDPQKIQAHTRDYRASVEQMDAAVGRVLKALRDGDLEKNTWIIFMGDNGWLLGEHGMTSKVLPYEESMRVPMAICGPSTEPRVSDRLVLNIDLTATIYELAGLETPEQWHGRSLLPLVLGHTPADWRTDFLYEAPTSQLGSQPLWAVRSERWKLIETRMKSNPEQRLLELYDLQADAIERSNLAADPRHRQTVNRLSARLREHQKLLTSLSNGQ